MMQKNLTLKKLLSAAAFCSLLFFSAIAIAAPAAPIATAPLGEISTASPEFVWQDQDDVTQYRLRLHDRLLRERVHVQDYNRSDICVNGLCSVQPGVSFGLSTDHVWYVRARNTDGNSLWVRSEFNYRDTVSTPVVLRAPTGEIDTASPKYAWTHESNFNLYRLHVRDLTQGKNLHLVDYEAADICTGAECEISLADLVLPESHQLYFRIRPQNTGRWGDWSDVSAFEVQLSVNNAGNVIISEFVASNQESLVDNTGDNSDWIELHNMSDAPVSLSGWALTAGFDTHVFDDTVIGAQEYLVIFASGKPSRTIDGELHVDFKLSADGESLVLADANGNFSFPTWTSTYPVQMPDISYGVDGNGDEFFFNPPTPGMANSGELSGFVEPVTFSLEHGFYNSPQSIVLSTRTASATVYYTIDGSTPSVSNGFSVASGTSISIDETTVLRAMATRGGWAPSTLETRSYIFAAEIAMRSEATPTGWPTDNSINGMRTFYGMDTNLTTAEQVAAEISLTTIPSVSITTDLENLFDPTTGIWANPRLRGQEWERPVSIELIDPTGAEPGFEINGGLRIKGNSSRNPANFKHSMRLVFNDEYGDGELNYPLHGDSGVSVFESLDLKTGQSWSWNSPNAIRNAGRGPDADWLRDVWSRDTQGAMGHLHTKSKYVHVYLNGQYWGLYYTEERVSNQYGSQYLGGDESDYDIIKQDTTLDSNPIEARDGTVDAWLSMWSMVEDHVLNDEEWARFQEEVNVVNLVDFYLLMWLSGDSDSTPRFTLDRSNNWLAVRDRTGAGIGGKWHFVDKDSESALCTNVHPDRMPDWNPTPPWNLEASLGFEIPDEYHLAPSWLLEAALTRPEFVQIFRDRVQLNILTPGGALTVDESIARLDNRLPIVNAAIDAEAARWGNTWIEPGFDRINWESASQNVRNCFELRTSVMLDYLEEDGLVH